MKQEDGMSKTLGRDGRLSRIRETTDSNDHRVKMFKELARLASFQAPEDPDEYRLRAGAHSRELRTNDRR